MNKPGNYVVNPLASKMKNPILEDFSADFNYPFFNNEGEIDNVTLTNWFTSVIDEVIKGPKDDYTTPEGVTPALDKSYHIWRYVTENTIPGVEMQKNGQSTGVVFKGQIVATTEALNAVDKDGNPDENIRELARIINNLPDADGNKPLTGDPAKDPIIYKFKGTKNNVGGMYATWPNVEQAAKAEAITPVWEADNTPAGGFWRLEINRSAPLFHAVFGDGSCGEYTFTTSSGDTVTVKDPITTVNEDTPSYAWHVWDDAGRPVPQSADQANEPIYSSYYKFKAAAVAADFPLYQTSFDGTNEYGYYCYYYYWNRH
ncbi:MAG: hypothetical protein K2H75_06055, partial [Muribaculaceae bacterium]|nr:hypothetical protein [Muribaculaceae bacterium]